MNRLKIAVGYEIRRIAFSKLYMLMVAVLVILSYKTLDGLVIQGVANTAPFSKWSYSTFMCNISTFLNVIVIMLFLNVFSKKEMAIRRIVFSTDISLRKYYCIKCISIFVLYSVCTIAILLTGCIFYEYTFNFYRYGDFIYPALLFLILPSIFIFGLCLFLGRINGKLLYILVGFTFFYSFINSTSGQLYFSATKLMAKSVTCDIPFILPDKIINSRILMLFTGIILFSISFKNIIIFKGDVNFE